MKEINEKNFELSNSARPSTQGGTTKRRKNRQEVNIKFKKSRKISKDKVEEPQINQVQVLKADTQQASNQYIPTQKTEPIIFSSNFSTEKDGNEARPLDLNGSKIYSHFSDIKVEMNSTQYAYNQ